MSIRGAEDAAIQRETGHNGFFPQFVVVMFVCIGFTSCQGGGSPGGICFSPDGSTIAFTCVKRIDLPLPPEMPTLYSTVYLQWCSADQLKTCRQMRIDSYGKSYGSFVQGQFELLFSPDSRRLAVKSPRYLEVVDLETQTRHRLTNPAELVTSMGWLDNTEMAYVFHEEAKDNKHSRGRTRKIYRHPIGDSPGKRQLLHEQNNYRGNCHDFVSPTGEHVVFMSQGYSEGLFCLLDVRTRKVTPLSGQKAQCQGVAWKPDGSCVFCLSEKEAFLYYIKEGRAKNISHDYDISFRRHLQFGPSIDDLWTPGGEYIVINSSNTGGCLVRPDPWLVIPIGKLLVRHLEVTEHLQVHRNPPDSYPWLIVQPYPGWVRLWSLIVTDQKPSLPGRTEVLEARNDLVDYEGKRFIPMKSSDSPGGAGTLTPDGKKTVYFNQALSLEEQSFHFPGNNAKSVP